MNFTLTPEQEAIRTSVMKLCEPFGDDYWLKKDREGGWPEDFHQAMASAGWLGVTTPREYGGHGLGITEAAVMIQAIGECGGGMTAVAAEAKYIYGLNPVVVFGTDEQKRRWLPPQVQGKEKNCFAITEPDAGLNTLRLKTMAVRNGDHYVMTGRKVWISSAQVADKMLILARTTPLEEVKKPTFGLSLFYTDIDRKYVELREIDKMGRKAVDSNLMFIDGLPVPVEDRIGEEGKGFQYVLHGMNTERILVGAGVLGLGRCALARATKYAKERIVFGRPIGQNQAIQHPLAESWMELEAANLMIYHAASLYDQGKPCGAEANAAKYLATEAAFKACDTAVMTHGGHGYAKDHHVERYLRECLIPRIAVVSQEMIKCFVAEKVLGLPKSY
jgi:acyl-CoA dehydrogenase